MTSKSFIPALRYRVLTGLYDFLINLTFPEKKIKQALVDQLQAKGNETILDFGCGTGTLTIMLKEQYPSMNVVGVDVDDQILAIAAKKIAAKGLSIRMNKYDGENLHFPEDHQFDKIVSTLVFHHIPTDVKRKVLPQLRRLLKVGGELHIADFGKAKNFYTRVALGLFRRIDGVENTEVNAQGLLPEFIKAAGFQMVELKKSYNTAFGTIDLIKAQ